MDLRSLETLIGRSAPFVAVTLLTACGNYTSDYHPPKDGRARAVWHEDTVVASMPEGSLQPDCSMAIREVQADPIRYRTYYGGSPTVVVWHPWIIVTSSHRHSTRSVPRTPARPTGISSGGGGGGGSIGGGGGSSSGGGSGGGDLGKAALVLVVVAIVAMPFINLGLGLGRPEPSETVAPEIDKVNAYNDLARLSGSPCNATEAP